MNSKASALIVACIAGMLVATHPSAAEKPITKPRQNAVAVSMLELIANGRQFDHWHIHVVGVFYYDGEWALLFSDSERFQLRDTTSSLQVDPAWLKERFSLSDQKLRDLSGSYVELAGKFIYTPRAKPEADVVVFGPDYAGEITSVDLLEVRRGRLR